jgi:hypothetical protein
LLRGFDLDQSELRDSDVKEIMVAPVRDQSGAFGVMVVKGRPESGMQAIF